MAPVHGGAFANASAGTMHADVGAIGYVAVLNGTACDGDLGRGAVGAVDEDVRRGWTAGFHVGFDVAAGDLHVADLAAAAHDTPSIAIADVAADDVRLMQVPSS